MSVLPRLAPRRANVLSICSSCRRQLNLASSFHRSRPNSAQGFHSSRQLQDDIEQQEQAQRLGDFYTDLLSTPMHKAPQASADLPTFARSGDETKEERARRLFGDMQSSGYERRTSETPDATWRTINGVPIPPRPAEPDNCCMSGCAHCVWDDYRDDVEGWAVRLRQAQAKSQGKGVAGSPKVNMPRAEVVDASTSMDDDGGGSEALWNTPSARDGEDLFEAIPVGIREFMATEKRIRDRQKAKKAKRKDPQ